MSNTKGVSLVEIILAMGLAAVILPALFYGFITVRDGRYREENRLEAYVLLKDLNEQVRSARDFSWNQLPPTGNTNYKPTLTGTNFKLEAGEETVGYFKRYVTLSDVYRDNLTGSLVATGGVIDKSTKKLDTYVYWGSGGPINTVTSTFYLTRHLNPSFWALDTRSQFDDGQYGNTESTDGGSVVLAQQPGGGSWASPEKLSEVDTTGNANGLGIALDGNYLYLSRAGTPGLSIVDVSDPESPIKPGTLNNTNTLYDVAVYGNYAYLASSSDSQELTIADVSNKNAPTQTSQNLGGNNDALSVAIVNNFLILTRAGSNNPELYTYSLTNPASPAQIGSLQLGSYSVTDSTGAGEYVYLATSNNTGEVAIVKLAQTGTPTLLKYVDLPGTADATSVAVAGDYLFVGRQNNTAGSELYILDITDRENPTVSGQYELGASINGLFAVDDELIYLATNKTDGEFTILDTSTKASPVLEGSYNMSQQANQVYVTGSYAYVSSNSDTAELTIFKGASTSQYFTSGTYESKVLDLGESAGFNYVKAKIDTPASTLVGFQIAMSEDANTLVYVGPGGTSALSDVYTSDGSIPIANNTGRYFKVKFFLTGDGQETPSLNSFNLDYVI